MEDCKRRIRTLDLLEKVRPLSPTECIDRDILKKRFLETAVKEEIFLEAKISG